jgi:hypothetical protein
MSLYISIIGIDGSGKSLVTLALADLAAAELGLTTAAISDEVWVKTSDEDLLRPDFAPVGLPLAARLNRLFRRIAKAATHIRWLYPTLKVIQLLAHEGAARQIKTRYRPELIFGDGHLLLTSGGWVSTYMSPPRPVPGDTTTSIPITHIKALYDYTETGESLPDQLGRPIPGLKLMRHLRRLDRRLKLGLTELPDALMFLAIEPETALARVMARDRKPDGHENITDMTQAQTMLRGVVEFFQLRRGESNTAVIDVTTLAPGQILEQTLAFVRKLSAARIDGSHHPDPRGLRPDRLGAVPTNLTTPGAVFKKALTVQYLIRHLLRHLPRGSARELAFPLSSLGRLSLQEGYSAGLMKAIYRQDSHHYGQLDRIFLNHPLHRAVYHRLQVLKRIVEKECRRRLTGLNGHERIKILTAPSGYAFDVLLPLRQVACTDQANLSRIHLLASDLDPDGRLQSDLHGTARQMGLSFEFMPGDLTSNRLRERFKLAGPYDLILFIGLSNWISKTDLLEHLKLVRTHLLAPGGVLLTDCFTPQVSSLSGKYLGYKANYYRPAEFNNLLTYSGFDLSGISWETGPDGIDHVCLARSESRPARPMRYELERLEVGA